MSTKEDCFFCKIAEKRVPALAVYEDDKVFGFLDISPRAVGHTLLIPKFHAETLAELPESEITPLFSAARSVAALLIKALGADGLTLGINQGKASGQVVEHLHVHLMPRFRNDGGGAIQSVVSCPPRMPLEEVHKKILENK
jgi:histidine triad (HIT) family protein